MRTISGILLFFLLICISSYLSAQTPLNFRDTTINGPQTFAIIVGVSKYKYIRPLRYADKDAELFRDFLKSPGGGSMKDQNIFFLLNETANNANFWSKGFQWLRAKDMRKGDRLFIYLAGHGDAIDEDQFFFLSVDCNPGGDKNNYLVGGAIQLFNLKKKIATETAKGVEVFFIMDACRSSELPGGQPGLNFLNTAITEKKAGEIIMLATAAGQQSLEDASIGSGHGLFTYYLVDGLAGMADSSGIPDNKVSFREIENYINKKVPALALQQFNRKQEPYFCCDENRNEIVSYVDTAWLNQWLKKKKSENRGPGNAIYGEPLNTSVHIAADTSLAQLYDLFNKAINLKKLTGPTSGEYYFEAMNKKIPASPYTLDARSTLEVEFITAAQHKVNKYIDCGEFSSKEKIENAATGILLEKAIRLLKKDDPDFANSLLGRMYFLKASGDFEKSKLSEAFQYAFAAYSLDPNTAYINNRLATLHRENNNSDSAIYYARKAIANAPKWRCGYATLASAYNLAGLTDSAKKYNQQFNAPDPSLPVDIKKKAVASPTSKFQLGIVAGGGSNNLNITQSNWDRGPINYNDSLISISANGKSKIELGIICHVNLSNSLSWRPALTFSSEKRNLVYTRKIPQGTKPTETVVVQTSSIIVGSPLVFRFSAKNVIPFLSAGPSFSFLAKQGGDADKVPVKSFDMIGDVGLGVDLNVGNKLVLSPELKFSAGFINIIQNANNIYTNTVSTLKRQAYTFNISVRKR